MGGRINFLHATLKCWGQQMLAQPSDLQDLVLVNIIIETQRTQTLALDSVQCHALQHKNMYLVSCMHGCDNAIHYSHNNNTVSCVISILVFLIKINFDHESDKDKNQQA